MSSTQQPDVLAVLDGFREARGSADDRAWAERAYYRLFRDDVRSSAAARALDQALDLVRESGEGPEELFAGPRSDWGARIARAVHAAVRRGAESWQPRHLR